MGTSPDVGGRGGLGRPLNPDIVEQQTTGQAIANKVAVGVTKDSLEQSFVKMNEGDVKKYSANPAKPFLKSKVLVAASHTAPPKISKQEQELFKSLSKHLPLQMSLQLAKDRKLPYSQRNPKFIVLEEILKNLAQFLVWSDSLLDVNPEAHRQKIENFLNFPKTALGNWLINGKDLLKTTKKEHKKAFLEPLVKEVEQYFKSKGQAQQKIITQLIKNTKLTLQHEMPAILKEQIQLLPPVLHALSHPLTTTGIISLTLAWLPGHPLFRRLAWTNEELSSTHHLVVQQAYALSRVVSTLSLVGLSGIAKKHARAKSKKINTDNMHTFAVALAATLIAQSDLIPYFFEMVASCVSHPDVKHHAASATLLASINYIISAYQGVKKVSDIRPLLEAMEPAILAKSEELKKLELPQEAAIALRQIAIATKRRHLQGFIEALPLNLDDNQELTNQLITLAENFYRSYYQREFMNVIAQNA